MKASVGADTFALLDFVDIYGPRKLAISAKNIIALITLASLNLSDTKAE
jgi:hypothetical protein